MNISKITDGFYRIGNDRIVKLVYDEETQRILSKQIYLCLTDKVRIPTEEVKGIANTRIEESQYVDFIDFLIEERYIRGDLTPPRSNE